ncbi:MAG: glycerophosphodiester phosphodiesterase family protein [Maricaulaceae bacterium]|jgi:glycerophosphoryl diester phosphodiesterase
MRKFLIGLVVVIGALWAWNASLFAPKPEPGATKLLAHRGVHQTFDLDGVEADTCTAERIHPPTHQFIENTIPSMQAAFDAGADVIEIDVHPTPDGELAVIHDWTLDCRTDGTGVTRETPMSVLRTLDIGYGYTADGGETYPLRGQGVGLMPTFDEVMDAFPEGRFLVNFKSDDSLDGEAVAARLAAHPEWRERIWASYGGWRPAQLLEAEAGVPGVWNDQTKDCVFGYLALGWTGRVPEACHDRFVMVPVNLRRLMWGWPHRFEARMNAAGSDVVLIGPYGSGDPGTTGIDSEELLDQVPRRFGGYVWTNKVEVIGPLLAARDG